PIRLLDERLFLAEQLVDALAADVRRLALGLRRRVVELFLERFELRVEVRELAFEVAHDRLGGAEVAVKHGHGGGADRADDVADLLEREPYLATDVGNE